MKYKWITIISKALWEQLLFYSYIYNVSFQNLLNRFSSLIILTSLSLAVTAQTSFKDGLKAWNNATLNDTGRLNAILESSNKIWRNEPDSSLILLFIGLPLAEQLDGRWKVSFLDQISNSYAIKSNYDSSRYYCYKALNESLPFISLNQLSKFHNKLGLAYSELGPYDSATKHLRLAQSYALEAQDTLSSVQSVINLARLLGFKGDYKSSEIQLKRALNLTRGTRFKREYAYLNSNWGGLRVLQGDYTGGLNLMMEALKTHDQMEDIAGQANVEGQIGTVYRKIEEYKLSVKYLKSSMKKAHLMGNELQSAGSYVELATTYNRMGNYDSSIAFARKALKVFENIKYPEGIAIAKNTIGLNYLMTRQYKPAIEYFNQVLIIAEDNTLNFDLVHSNLAQAYYGLAMYAKVIKYGLMAERKAQEKGSLPEMEQATEILHKGYMKIGAYEKAYQYLKLHAKFSDSLKNEKAHRNMVHKEYEYQYKKEALADSLNQVQEDFKTKVNHQTQLSRKNRTRNILIGIGILLLTIASGALNRTRYIKRSNLKLAKEKKRAEQSEAFKQQFLANMSHEIRTPMNAILGMTNLTLDTQLTEKQKNYLEGVKLSSESLLVIINDILDLSKIEAGKLELEKVPFDLQKAIEQVHATLRYQAEEKNLDFTYSIDEDVPQVLFGDPSRLRQILINLAGNAIKFTENGQVSIEVKQEELGIQFLVKDTGIGMDKKTQSILFESFQQADKSTTRRYGGTGLGLSISKTLVELMRGDLHVESQLGNGSTFFFTIKMKAASLQDLNSKLQADFDHTNLENICILLAEDNKYNQIVVLDTLQHMVKNAKVDVAKNGREAVEMVQIKHYDVVLMDSDMPEMDGREATRKIRQLDTDTKNIPIIALTSSVLATEIQKCFDAGMNDSIPKPFEREVFFATIGKYYQGTHKKGPVS